MRLFTTTTWPQHAEATVPNGAVTIVGLATIPYLAQLGRPVRGPARAGSDDESLTGRPGSPLLAAERSWLGRRSRR
jgi:hypothetical protein